MNAAALLNLQEIDTALTAVANRRPRLPERAAHQSAAAELAGHQAKIDEAKAVIDAAQAAIEAAEHAADELTVKRTRLEGQLKTIIAPREAEALMHQIETLNQQRGELDDQELAALDQQAEGEATLEALLAELPALEAAFAASAAELQRADAELDEEAASLHARRPAAAAELTESELAAFERAKQHFDGVAIARLDGHRCHGCHLDLSPAEMDQVKATPADAVPECPQCGRYLVR